MTLHKNKLNRYLLLDSIVAVIGILLISSLFFYGIARQQRFADNLFQHPFAVSNAGLDFRSDVLELRKYMLEHIVSRKAMGEAEFSNIHRLEDQMSINLMIIRREFLGDQTRVDRITHEIDTWKQIREPIKTNLVESNFDEALNIATHQASPHIEQILEDADYVIGFARSRAALFVEEGRTELIRTRLLLVLLAAVSLASYLLLSYKLRRVVHQIYDKEEFNATFDALSGAYNRRSFMKHGDAEVERAQRYGLSLSLLMMDLDHFKNINDSHGHEAGDSVLRQFSEICHLHLREVDYLGRIGGDEFAILLPHSDVKAARDVAERIRQMVADRDFEITSGECLKLTTSIGAASFGNENFDINKLLKRADEAMYRSKNEGRNRVTEG